MNNLSENIIDDFTILASKQARLAGLVELLKFIAHALGAEGCILWGQPKDASDEDRYLFTLAHWFKNGNQHALHNISFEDSLAGKAISEDTELYIKDVKAVDFPYKKSCSRLLKDPKIQSYLSVPVRFKHMPVGALNVYINHKLDDPPARTLNTLTRIASLIPGLYQSIRERAGFHLLKEVNRIFYDAGESVSEGKFSDAEMNAVIQQVCQCVSAAFQAKETTILLEDEYNHIVGYEVRGTTCPRWIKDADKWVYRGKIDEGLTGYCLHYRDPVRIFDLRHFGQEKAIIRSKYPGLIWRDPFKLQRKAIKEFGGPAKDLPPISFMAAPIVMEGNDRLVGAIRCTMATKGPFYFSEEDLDLLKLVALRIGQAWRSWIHQRTILRETETWKGVIDGLHRLNRFVWEGISEERLEENQLFDQVFKTVTTILPEASIMDVRLYDEKRDCLFFKYLHGDAWHYREDGTERSKDEKLSFEKRVFSLKSKERPTSVGEIVYKTGSTQVINDFNDPVMGKYVDSTFKDVKRLIVAPLPSTKGKVLGVLDIRSEQPGIFPKHSETIFSLFGQQIGLFIQLMSIFEEKRKLFAEKKRTYENLAHQLKTPIDQAFKRSDLILQNLRSDYDVDRRLRQIRGLCNKAKAVTGAIKLFAALEQGIAPKINSTYFSFDNYMRMLVECAADNQLMTSNRLNLEFIVDRNSFSFLNRHGITLCYDYDLYLQALNNLLDNAGKYSYPNSKIVVQGGQGENPTYFFASVRNYGFKLTSNDSRRCIQRGWRGSHADYVRASGTGIGLWIADHIMKAHHGRLEIIPTDGDGWTEFRLILPLN